MSLICFLMPLFKNAGSAGWDDDENKNDGGARMLEHFVSLEGGAGDAMSDEAAYRKLKQLFAPFVLRRGKDVLSQTMPKKVSAQ
jgi:SWI/SNF-related matrix-associated actin-dependent regulator 1 of chromatin subfamily A